jgi:Leucine-rich repeat (LRR) protein
MTKLKTTKKLSIIKVNSPNKLQKKIEKQYNIAINEKSTNNKRNKKRKLEEFEILGGAADDTTIKKKLVNLDNDTKLNLCYTKDDITCPICFENYFEKEDWFQINTCGHCICKNCENVLFTSDHNIITSMPGIKSIHNWWTSKKQCPVCMVDIDFKKQYHIKDGCYVIDNVELFKYQINTIKLDDNLKSFIIEPIYRINKFNKQPYEEVFQLLKDIDNLDKIELHTPYKKPPENLQNIKALKKLTIVGPHLEDFENNIPIVEELKISKAPLKYVPRFFYNSQIQSLTKLCIEKCPSLFDNNDDIFSYIQKYSKLEHLSLNKNNIAKIPDGLFDNLIQLKTLSLHENKLTGNLPSSFKSCTNLQNISLSYNQFNDVPKPLKMMITENKLPYLQKMFLSGNNISSVPNELLEHKEMKVLHVATNMWNQSFKNIPGSFELEYIMSKLRTIKFIKKNAESAEAALERARKILFQATENFEDIKRLNNIVNSSFSTHSPSPENTFNECARELRELFNNIKNGFKFRLNPFSDELYKKQEVNRNGDCFYLAFYNGYRDLYNKQTNKDGWIDPINIKPSETNLVYANANGMRANIVDEKKFPNLPQNVKDIVKENQKWVEDPVIPEFAKIFGVHIAVWINNEYTWLIYQPNEELSVNFIKSNEKVVFLFLESNGAYVHNNKYSIGTHFQSLIPKKNKKDDLFFNIIPKLPSPQGQGQNPGQNPGPNQGQQPGPNQRQNSKGQNQRQQSSNQQGPNTQGQGANNKIMQYINKFNKTLKKNAGYILTLLDDKNKNDEVEFISKCFENLRKSKKKKYNTFTKIKKELFPGTEDVNFKIPAEINEFFTNIYNDKVNLKKLLGEITIPPNTTQAGGTDNEMNKIKDEMKQIFERAESQNNKTKSSLNNLIQKVNTANTQFGNFRKIGKNCC